MFRSDTDGDSVFPDGLLDKLFEYRAVWIGHDFVVAITTLAFISTSWCASLVDGSPQWLAPILGLAGVCVGGAKIAVSAGRGLLARQLNVDELVTVAIVAAVILGEYLSAGLVAFMMLLGKLLEDFTAERAELALEGLGSLLPATARRQVRQGVEEEIPVELIQPGDIVIIRPGERIPVDGDVVVGQAAVDQAALTGEPLPSPRGPGDEVLAGGFAHQGTLEVRTTRVGDLTGIGRMRQLVGLAGKERAQVVRRADQYAKWFTPSVLALAFAVYVITWNWTIAITVLVVACPCALVLATPTAIIAGVVNLARYGILVKSGARLESAGRVTAVLLDKTGTLTLGQPSLLRIISCSGQPESDLLALASAVEKRSEHPLARAILAAASAAGLDHSCSVDPDSFRATPGRGTEADVKGNRILVGSMDWFHALGTTLAPAAEAACAKQAADGRTVVGIAVNGSLAGALVMADTPRPEAISLISGLRQAGIGTIMMLTGDAPAAAQSVAHQVGIHSEEVRAGLVPEKKEEIVRLLQDRGEVVAMIGDGVNDALALTRADVAIAVGVGGTDVALDVSDIALLTSDIGQIATALQVSRDTLSTIRQNLGIALAWNVGSLIAAALGLVGPVGGAIAHNIGSVIVVFNAARLASLSKIKLTDLGGEG